MTDINSNKFTPFITHDPYVYTYIKDLMINSVDDEVPYNNLIINDDYTSAKILKHYDSSYNMLIPDTYDQFEFVSATHAIEVTLMFTGSEFLYKIVNDTWKVIDLNNPALCIADNLGKPFMFNDVSEKAFESMYISFGASLDAYDSRIVIDSKKYYLYETATSYHLHDNPFEGPECIMFKNDNHKTFGQTMVKSSICSDMLIMTHDQ